MYNIRTRHGTISWHTPQNVHERLSEPVSVSCRVGRKLWLARKEKKRKEPEGPFVLVTCDLAQSK